MAEVVTLVNSALYVEPGPSLAYCITKIQDPTSDFGDIDDDIRVDPFVLPQPQGLAQLCQLAPGRQLGRCFLDEAGQWSHARRYRERGASRR